MTNRLASSGSATLSRNAAGCFWVASPPPRGPGPGPGWGGGSWTGSWTTVQRIGKETSTELQQTWSPPAANHHLHNKAPLYRPVPHGTRCIVGNGGVRPESHRPSFLLLRNFWIPNRDETRRTSRSNRRPRLRSPAHLRKVFQHLDGNVPVESSRRI